MKWFLKTMWLLFFQVVKRITDGGADYSFECVGETAVINTALQSCCDVIINIPSSFVYIKENFLIVLPILSFFLIPNVYRAGVWLLPLESQNRIQKLKLTFRHSCLEKHWKGLCLVDGNQNLIFRHWLRCI